MDTGDLSAAIEKKAMELGYRKCGIVAIREMGGYADKLAGRADEHPDARPLLDLLAGFADVKKERPWAESVIVLIRNFGQFRLPKHLKGHIASAYLCGKIHVENSPEYRASRAFGEYLGGLGIRAETDDKLGVTALRWAAMRAGLGIIRKNNFLYTEDGSLLLLSGWLVDRLLELKVVPKLKSCPDGCRKCLDACPTRALSAPYSMNPMACVAFKTGFGGDDLPTDPASEAMGGWIYGCDNCQLACPFNAGARNGEMEYPGLADFGGKVSLTKIIDMDYDEIHERFAEEYWYISETRLWKWKVNALNAMKNGYKDDYLPWIRKACNDPAPQVRAMAEWVFEKTAQQAGIS